MRGRAGFAIVEVMIAAILVGAVALGSVQTLDRLNRNASSNRVITNARAIVQRNVDTALSVTCSKTSIPPILAITTSAGSVYDDDGGTANLVTIAQRGSSTVELARGTLTRIVTPVDNSDDADIRQIIFRVDYTYLGRNHSYSLSTMRAIDD
jgi:type II secretory pathway pseudopilin PulG